MKTAKALFISSLLALMLAFTACGDASAPAAETTLTVSTYFYDEQINFAAKRFQETHEGVTVEVIPFIDIDGQWREPEEYSQMINAAIMSGGGEDIIDVSQVTWEKLADKNKLVDLNQYLKLNPEELRMNILDAFLYNGKRFAVPLSFHFEAYRFNQAYRDDSSPEDLNLLKLTALATGHGGSKLIESGGGFNESILAEIIPHVQILFSPDCNGIINWTCPIFVVSQHLQNH